MNIRTGQNALVSLATAALLALGLAGCGATVAPSGSGGDTSGSTSEEVAPAAPEADSDYGVVIEAAQFATDYEGKKVIVVDFTFTNNSSKPASFLFSLNAQAYQGGIELDNLVIGVEGIDAALSHADIKPGTTVTVQQPYILRDDSPVTVEVEELITFDDAMLATKEFTVS